MLKSLSVHHLDDRCGSRGDTTFGQWLFPTRLKPLCINAGAPRYS